MKPVIIAFIWLCLTHTEANPNCRPLQVNFCGSVGYTSSASPSGVSGYTVRDVQQIVETACSPDVATLMCRVVVPECGADEDSRLKPCRSLCERVKSTCKGTLKEKHIPWPSHLRCNSLPQDNCVQGSTEVLTRPGGAVCEPITIRLCSDLPYNLTVMPNMLGHQTQNEAVMAVNTFSPLVQVGCSPVLKEFLCSVYAPECINGNARAPCRRVCERARAGCETIMNNFGSIWPESLNCEKFKTDTCDAEPDPTPVQCEPISGPYCSDMPYTQMGLPNSLGHRSQQQIDQELYHFQFLIRQNCSPALKPFLCSVYTPECQEGRTRPPCRTLCEEARAACEPLLIKKSMSWTLNCDAYDTTSCPYENGDPESSVKQILERLNTGGISVDGNSLTVRTAYLLLIYADADRSWGLNPVEYFKMGQFVASIRREYLEMRQGHTPPVVDENDLLNALVLRGLIAMDRAMVRPLWRLYKNSDGNSIDFDDYVAVVTRLQILKARFLSNLLNIPCDCRVSNFSYIEFIKAVIF